MLKLTAGYCFAGGGGDCWGSVCAGYSPLWAIEKDRWAAAVFRHRFPKCQVIEANIRELSDDFLSSLPVPSLYIFGSPCPDFSTAGHRAGIAGTRGSLFFEGLRPLRLLQIPYFIFENVQGIFSSSSHPARQYAARIVQRYETGGWGLSKETYALALSVKKFHQGSDFKRILARV